MDRGRRQERPRAERLPQGRAESRLRAVHHRARTGLRRLSQRPFPSRPRRAPQPRPLLPLGHAAGRLTRKPCGTNGLACRFALAGRTGRSHLSWSRDPRGRTERASMNFMRTAMLLAALTAIFMGVGYLVGGTGGMFIALPRRRRHEPLRLLERRQDGAPDERRPRGRRAHRARVLWPRAGAGAERRPPDAAGLCHRQPAAERLRHRPQSGECRGRRDHRPPALARPRGDRRR